MIRISINRILDRMRNLVAICFALLVVCIPGCSSEKTRNFDLIISNVNLIDGTGKELQTGMNVFIKGNQIHAINSSPITQNENIIDGTGKYLIPGLYDCHTHTNDYKNDLPRFMHYGVTSIFVTGGSTCTDEYYRQMRAMGNQDSLPAPRVYHTSQHFISEGSHPVKTYKGSNWKEGESFFTLRDTAQISESVKKVSKHPIEGIKLTIEDGPYPPFVKRMPQEFIDLVSKRAHENGTRVFVHVSDNIELKMAIDAGIKNIVHYTGVDLDFEKDQELIKKIYRDSVSWITTLMLDKSMMYPNNPDWFSDEELHRVYAPEAFEKMNDPAFKFRADEFVNYFKVFYEFEDPTLQQVMQFQVEDIKELSRNGVNMVLGTDTGNDLILPGYSLHEEMQLMELGGIAPVEIIKMGTLNAAVMLRISDHHGSIEQGKIADMLLLDKNPLESIKNTLSIDKVIKNGKIQRRISGNSEQ